MLYPEFLVEKNFHHQNPRWGTFTAFETREVVASNENRKNQGLKRQGWGSLTSQRAQKRDKSSTLISILPLFALWNTILNGMGAQ